MSNCTSASLRQMKAQGEPIPCLTCYDASFARLLEAAGVPVLLVGDSLGMVVQGWESTLPVTLDQMIYHSACVARGRRQALLVADLPFLTYSDPKQALKSAARLLQEGGAQMVKLEGGFSVLETVQLLTDWGIPVCGHLGLLPQSVHRLGGYRYQGRDAASAQRIREEALALQEAGAELLILECVPADLARSLRAALSIPVIGIGAGPDCDGQILVLYDLLGLNPHPPRFSRVFLQGGRDLAGAVRAYVEAVQSRTFPGPEETRY